MPRLELNHLDLAPRHLAQLQALLAAHVPDAEVWAYGSRVTGGSHEGSDLDLVLRNAGDSTREVNNWAALKDALQQSMLPMMVDVHVWPHLPKAFHENIEAGYVVIPQA